MSNILDKIVEQKKKDLEIRKLNLPLRELRDQAEKVKKQASFLDSLNRVNQTNIIAEVKRVSPSKGPLRPDLDPIELASDYYEAGASAISVLTEEKFFHGSDDDLKKVRQNVSLPILRKDFTIDEYQIWEAKVIGASAILLIAAILTEQQLCQFSSLANSLDLDVLLEVHDEEELKKALVAQPKILGVNNRNLKTFDVSLQTSLDLREKYKSEDIMVWVSESGIFEKKQINELLEAGFKAFLIGESLLKHQNPGEKLQELIH